MSEEANNQWSLVLQFTNDTQDYAHGFAMGMLWEKLRERPEVIEETIHEATRPQVEIMARRLGYRAEFLTYDDGPSWLALTLKRLE